MDTCALSEAMKTRPDDGLAAWIAGIDPLQVYISVVTLGEIRKGIECSAGGARKAGLEAWLTSDLAQQFNGRVLPFDADVADRWGRLVGQLQKRRVTAAAIDSLIGATALQHNLSVVTRNEKHFRTMGIAVTNPWSGR